MKTLVPRQQEAHDFFVSCHNRGENTLDTSHVGTGKTVVACHMARTYGGPVAVVCPKSVIPSWKRELAECGITPVFVLNYEKLRAGKTPFLSKRGKKIMRWHIPDRTLVLVDEVHKAKGPYTQNAQLLISLVQQSHRVHMMSATAAEDPSEMRAIGFALGLHKLNDSDALLRNWYSWMREYGCVQDDWGKWVLMRRSMLKSLRAIMYSNNVKRLTVEDFPDSFRANRVFIERVLFNDHAKIRAAYDKAGLTPDVVEQFIEHGTVEDHECMLVNILRARQLAESFKVGDLVEMALDLVQEGNSVVLFVNFKDTVELLCQNLNCDRIEGGQSVEERQSAIDKFQRDDAYVLVVNTAAGGTGVSLHDQHGCRPRVALHCPTFNPKDYAQALGRIHRNGAKSDAVQKILVADDTIEEAVLTSVQKRISNMNLLHNEE